MKIKTRQRCEDGSHISLKAADKAEAEKLCGQLMKDDHCVGATVTAVVGGNAIINYVGRYERNTEYEVPPEVGKHLVQLKLARKIK